MLVLSSIILKSLHSVRAEFFCPFADCPKSSLGNQICDLGCNNLLCNFDSSQISDQKSNFEVFLSSDCLEDCLQAGCSLDLLANGKCDESCNNRECGFDLAQCGICAQGCWKSELLNGKCDEFSPCNSEDCQFDLSECNACVPGCGKADLAKKNCENLACGDEKCKNVEDNPCFRFCAPGCLNTDVGNGRCDEFCNTESCDFDRNDCLCAPGCTEIELQTDCKGLFDPCNNERCGFKDQKCGTCASQCFEEMINDGKCDQTCFNQPCRLDGDDCKCSEDCFMLIRPEERQECLKPGCWLEFNSDSEDFEKRSEILSFLLTRNYSYFDVQRLPPGCSLSQLKMFDLLDGPKCSVDSPCYSKEALWCLGRHESLSHSCLRATDDKCLVCEGVMVGKDCYSEKKTCPENSEENLGLGSLFSMSPTFKWCTETFLGTENNPETFYVKSVYLDEKSLENKQSFEWSAPGKGSKDDPFISLYLAFLKVSKKNSRIVLSRGNFLFGTDAGQRNEFNPLPGSDNLESLSIEGSDPGSPSVVFWDTFQYDANGKIRFLSLVWPGKRIFIKNIVFNGKKLLSSFCPDEVFCLHCSEFTQKTQDRSRGQKLLKTNENDKDGLFADQESKSFKTLQSSLCEASADLEFFVFHQTAFLKNVTFKYFGNNFKTLIKTFGSLKLENVDFSMIQGKNTGSVVQVVCLNDCQSSEFRYFKGNVNDLNPGFLTTGSFLMVDGVRNVGITEVHFKFSAFYSKTDPESYLLRLAGVSGETLIDQCKFSNIYADSLVLFDSDDAKAPGYSEVLFQISDSEFEYIYTKGTFFSILMKCTSFRMTDVKFFKVYSSGTSLLNLTFDGDSSKMEEKTLDTQKKQNYPKVEFTGVSFLTVASSGYLIFINNQKVSINNFQILHLNDGTQDLIIEIIQSFPENLNFIKKTEPNIFHQFASSGVLNIENSKEVNIEKTFLNSVKCSESLILVKSSENLTLRSVELQNIQTAGSVLRFSNIKELTTIKNARLTSINSKESGISIINCKDILVESYQSMSLFVADSPIVIKNFTSFVMINSSSSFTESQGKNSGFLILMTSANSQSYINITTGSFSGIKTFAQSGLILIDSPTDTQSHSLYLKNLKFQNISAEKAVFFHLTQKFSIKDSMISEIRGFRNSFSTSMIFDCHKAGLLKLANIEFSENQGIQVPGILAKYRTSEHLLLVWNMKVFNCSQGVKVFSLSGNSIEVSLATFKNLSVFDVRSLNSNDFSETFEIKGLNVQVERFSANDLNSLADVSSAGLEIKTGTFFSFKDSLVTLKNRGFFKCFECKIFENNGALFRLNGLSSIEIENSEVFDNSYTGSRSSILEIDSNEKKGQVKSVIKDSVFKDNQSKASKLMNFVNADVLIINSSFINNIALNSESDLAAYSTDLKIRNCLFYRETRETLGNFISTAFDGSLDVSDSSFLNSTAKFNGGALSADKIDSLRIFHCLFTNNTSLQAGGAVYVRKTQVYIERSMFELNSAVTGSDLYLVGSESDISDSVFRESLSISEVNQVSIKATGNSLSLTRVIIENLAQLVSGLHCYDLQLVEIQNSFFFNIHGLDFGAVFIEGGKNEGNLVIKNSTFRENSSKKHGGAIRVSDSNLFLEDCLIESNKAELEGSGLYLEASLCKACTFNLSGQTKILNNKGKNEENGLKSLKSRTFISNEVFFSNNSGPESNSYFLSITRRELSESNSSDFNYLLENIPPGQPFSESLLIYIRDSYNEVVKTDNSSVLTLITLDENVIISGQSSFTAVSGCFNMTGFILLAKPGSTIDLFAQSSSISSSDVRNDNATYTNYLIIRVQVRKCVAGEATESNACTVCPKNKFLIKEGKVCKSCPTGGICPGGSEIDVKPGYYRCTNTSEILYSCPQRDSCLGNPNGFNTSCKSGYTGITCNVCEDGFTRSNDGSCGRCPEENYTYFILVAIIFGFLVIGTILVRTSISSAFTQKAKYSIYIKIFTNYMQLIFLTTDFSLSWPSYVMSLFGAQHAAVSALDTVFSFDCYSGSKTVSKEGIYLSKLVLYSMLPVVILVFSTIIWIFLCMYYDSFKYLKRELPLTISVMFFLIHPNLVKFMFSNFSCRAFDQIGSYLRDDLSIKCWTPYHIKLSLTISFPSIILWSVGIPTLVLISMIKKRKNLYKDQNRVIFGFLCNGYKSFMFFWEFLIMYRKIAIICVVVFMAQISAQVQALTVTLVLLVSLFIQYKTNPYNSSELNFMELEALLTATLTIYCGLYYATNEIGNTFKINLFLLIVLGNAYFVMTWVFWISRAFIDILAKFFPFLKSLLKKGDAYGEEFYDEKISIKGSFFSEPDRIRYYTFINLEVNQEKFFNINSMDELFLKTFKKSLKEPEMKKNQREEKKDADLIGSRNHEVTSLVKIGNGKKSGKVSENRGKNVRFADHVKIENESDILNVAETPKT